MLEVYLEADPYSDNTMPKFIDPQFLDSYLRVKVTRDSPPQTYWRSFELLRFYGLSQTVAYFNKFLNRNEKTRGEYSSSIAIVMMMAYVGSKEDRKAADMYYQGHLLNHSQAAFHFPLLLQCWTALGPESPLARLKTLSAEKKIQLDSLQATSDEAYVASQNLARFIDNDIPRAEKAMLIRVDIEKADEDEINRRIISVYSGLAPAYGEYLQGWATFRLMRQVVKGPEATSMVIDELRSALEDLPQQKTLASEIKQFVKTRLLKAIEFFDETKLKEDEKVFLKKSLERGQDDPISTIQPK
ncbi:MAG: hypothetical protein U9N60_00260 [Thermodesulfobacteriota bacterium]|nr:hypothetical protein [Thermodesulfobacteriota bacterium]